MPGFMRCNLAKKLPRRGSRGGRAKGQEVVAPTVCERTGQFTIG